MYTPKKAYFYGTGRRKSSIARVRLIPGGTGVITINNRTLDNYFGMETLKYIVKQPIETVGVAEKFDGEVSADNSVQIITDAATIYLPLADIIDFEKEKARLEGEKKRLEGEIERIVKKLSNEGFVAKAPAAVVEGEKAKMAKYQENLDNVIAALSKL